MSVYSCYSTSKSRVVPAIAGFKSRVVPAIAGCRKYVLGNDWVIKKYDPFRVKE